MYCTRRDRWRGLGGHRGTMPDFESQQLQKCWQMVNSADRCQCIGQVEEMLVKDEDFYLWIAGERESKDCSDPYGHLQLCVSIWIGCYTRSALQLVLNSRVSRRTGLAFLG